MRSMSYSDKIELQIEENGHREYAMLLIKKVLSRPEVPSPNTLYFERSLITGFFKIYLTDDTGAVIEEEQAGSADVAIAAITAMINEPNGIAGLNATGFLDTSIKINGQDTAILTADGGYMWDDNVQGFTVKSTSGGNNPGLGTWMGNFQGLLFDSGNMNQVWIDFHIQHDYAMGTYLFPHVHWTPTTNAAGTVRWGFEYMVAKGHQQQKFANPVTAYVNHAFPANYLGMHMVSEVSAQDAIPPLNVEPDSYVRLRIFRDASNGADTYGADVHAWCADLHYQKARMGTKNKAPDFFV